MRNNELREMAGALSFSEAPYLLAMLDRSYEVVLANPAFLRVFGKGRGPCHELFKDREEPCEDCPLAPSFEDGHRCEFRQQGISAMGTRIDYRVHALPVLDRQGKVEFILQLCEDITPLIELEQELQQAERLASVGLSTAGLAHTIKNVLGGLEGGVYVVNSGLKSDNLGRVKSGWEMVQQYIGQLDGLVKNLLDFTRRTEPRREPVEPAELVRDVVQLYESKAELVSVHMEGQTEPGLPPLSLDRAAMHASLTNLVANALDACMLDPDESKLHQIRVLARTGPGRGVTFEVTDNGMGISEQDQRRVFSALFTTKGLRGTGLGLLLTRKAVREHGGEVRFKSTPGKGTSFFIDLPGEALPLSPDTTQEPTEDVR